MFDENIEDQLVLAPKLAEFFANDEAFIFEIGLDEFGFEYRRQQLVLRIGFILAMHRTMKSIFRYQPHLNLDDKFVMLIHSRISLIPEQVEDYPDPNEYAKQCYIEAKQNVKDLGIEWEAISLKEKFFEVCLRTEAEEEKVLLMNPTDTKDELWKIGHHNIFSLLFEKTFEYVKWELDQYGEDTNSWKDNQEEERQFVQDYKAGQLEVVVFNADGAPAGKVVFLPDGKYQCVAWDGFADLTSVLMSTLIVKGDTLTSRDKDIFAKWSGILGENWIEPHYQAFAITYFHWIKGCPNYTEKLSEEVSLAVQNAEDTLLLKFQRRLTRDIRNLFERVFGESLRLLGQNGFTNKS